MPDHNRRPFKASDLQKVEGATYEEVVVGDFVHLASGSPLGLVQSMDHGQATVVWFNSDIDHTVIPWVCLRPLSDG